MIRNVMVGLAIAAIAGCSGIRENEEYVATDAAAATATAQARQKCAGAGLAPKESRRFQVYDSDRGRMADRLYYTCGKPER